MALVNIKIMKVFKEGAAKKLTYSETTKRISFFGIPVKKIYLQEDVELHDDTKNPTKVIGFNKK